MNKTILVTGVTGFVGRHLIRELRQLGHKVVGLGQGKLEDREITRLLANYYKCDLVNPKKVSALDLSGVDVVINLAGLARVGDSFKDPALYERVNVEVLTNLAGELLKQKASARMVAISTGAVYDPDQPMPLTESSKTIKSGSPYAESKLHMEQAIPELRERGLDCVVARPFNHIGPGQSEGFLLPDLYYKIIAAKNLGGAVKVGNLSTKRDYTDVRDIVRAYTLLALAPNLNHGIYNVCSGKSRSGDEILESLLNTMGLSGQIAVETDQSLIRPSDPANLYGSYKRLHEETGWKPTVPLEQTIKDFVNSQVG